MLGQPGQSDSYLSFSVFGIPVRIHWFFWVVGVLLGADNFSMGIEFLLGWMLVFFVSILGHELGHALAAVYFGYRPQILLYGMGGLAQYTPTGQYNRGQSITIVLAGPFAGYFLAVVGLVASPFVASLGASLPGRIGSVLNSMVVSLIIVNLFWSTLNLMPVLPLDGGQICRDILTYVDKRRGMTWTRWIGVFVGGIIAATFLMLGAFFGALLFFMIALQNYQALQMERWR
ncbi:MAG: hypothetical protein KDA69_11065 [Planctomycetaceae bacterium]|nr:hypothetical protein [Planctomycetaceae bacterium]MCA9044852.1 hypothetical protein [Planctomycetaceae bacterium]MCB9952478.1 hypothetical protein [Planctomycetaceae bacterium]